jgi:hypothetical protein
MMDQAHPADLTAFLRVLALGADRDEAISARVRACSSSRTCVLLVGRLGEWAGGNSGGIWQPACPRSRVSSMA